MSDFQLLACTICIGGSRDNTVVRDSFDPVTYPEMLVLQLIHGGPEYITDVHSVGVREIEPSQEKTRLQLTYGAGPVLSLFPGQLNSLPLGDNNIPTLEEVQAANAAAKDARAKVRLKKATPPVVAPKPRAPAIPDQDLTPDLGLDTVAA